jgi:uncharacterized protein YcnI
MFRRTLIASVALVVALATPAVAHVSVTPAEVPRGTTATLTFRVPTESETASTNRIEIVFPDGADFAAVEPAPKAGWTHTVSRTGITWIADVGGIPPGGADTFSAVVGPVPSDGETLVFKALQTYTDGTVVRWIDEGSDAAKPAPTLALIGDAPTTTSTTSTTQVASTGADAESVEDEEDTGGSSAGGVVLLTLLALAVVAGLATALRRARRR